MYGTKQKQKQTKRNKAEVFSDTNLPQETKKKKKSNINHQTLQLNQLEKEEQTKPKDSRKKEILKIRADINDLEAKRSQ